MKSVFVLLALASSTISLAEDVELHQEAVRLLEKATAVSTIAVYPNLERTDTFRVFGTQAVQEGRFTRVVIQGVGRRDETTFGNYHVIDVLGNGQLATVRTNEIAPPEVENLYRLTPISLVQFDDEDIIHAITTREVGGRFLDCIEFETIAGSKSQANELCMDGKNETLASAKLFGESIENTDFFVFAGALIPGKKTYSKAGVLNMEITQTMVPLSDTDANILAAPPNAELRHSCKTFRRAFGEFMPQPKAGNGGSETDVVLRGLIEDDGAVHEAVVQSSERPDLNPEALSLIGQWRFTPQLCDGKPNRTEASFTLHFQGR